EAERPRAGLGDGDGPQFGDRPATADHEKVLPSLNPVQQSVGVPPELLQADGTHVGIVAGPGVMASSGSGATKTTAPVVEARALEKNTFRQRPTLPHTG